MKFAQIFAAVAALWLTVTTVLSLAAGWYRLAARYPNRPEEPLIRVRAGSATMGLGVHMQNLITLRACPSGLRVSMLRIFGPFCRNFFVPWEEVAVARGTTFFTPVATLRFGHPPVGTLTVESFLANQLAHAAGARWPERGPIPVPTKRDLRRRLTIRWAAGTAIGATFFTVASIAMRPNGPPIAVAILFPAIVFGFFSFVQYLWERRTLQ